MISLPRLNKKQVKDLKEMKLTEGWVLVRQIIDGSIQMSNASLINWNFTFDKDAEPVKKRILDFKEKRLEVDILKKFLHFIDNPVIIKNEEE